MFPTRDDVPVREVAEKFVAGASFLALAAEYDASMDLVQRRVRKARTLYPELDWAARDAQVAVGPTVKYVTMTDGKPGRRGTSSAVHRGRRAQ